MNQVRSKIKLKQQFNQENETQTGRNAHKPNNQSCKRITQEIPIQIDEIKHEKEKEIIPKLEHGSEG